MFTASLPASTPRPHVASTASRVVALAGVATAQAATTWSSTAQDRPARVRQHAPALSATGGVPPCGESQHERTVTVVFTDIEDSTVLVERLGDRGWLELFRRHSELVQRHVSRHRGVVVKAQGDGFMAAFADPAGAVDCAVAIQRDLAAAAATAARSGEEPLRVRIGVHTGRAIRQAGDFHGRTVVIAARIAAQARGAEILVSGAVARAARRPAGVAFAARGAVALKGLCGRHAVYVAEWAPRPVAVAAA
jgi:class 3 adenylate cyclase